MSIAPRDGRGDHGRKLSARALRWFREKLRMDLVNAAAKQGECLPDAFLDALVEPFLADPGRWLQWVPDDYYRPGSALAPGQWVPALRRYEGAVLAAIVVQLPALRERERRAAARGEPATAADVEAALQAMECTPAMLGREPAAWSLLDPAGLQRLRKAQRRVLRRRERRQRQTPQSCSCCHELFAGKLSAAVQERDDPPRRSAAAGPVCPACQAAKQRRCISCDTVFPVRSQRERRCPACLDREAEYRAGRPKRE